MEIDQTEEKSNQLKSLNSNYSPLPIAITKLSSSSRIIPSEKDFHFYNNFHDFKNPVSQTDEKSKTLLTGIGKLDALFGKVIEFPDDKSVELDDDLASDWLVNVNDEIYERFDASLDDFKRSRAKESGKESDLGGENGFQVVLGKKNRKVLSVESGSVDKGTNEVKMAAKVKPKIPFHVPGIPRPQDEYKIIVNNINQPFEHVWLSKSEDGARFVHPLEKLNVLDFIDNSVKEPEKPPPIENTPFYFVEDVKELKQLASKLKAVNEFAVDLEHNQYRSFQGMTCLMQISTRTEDFVIDTLKLRIHIGPHLREVFKDPTKRKVLHGANSDITWLQRDFGIYVCNMFDTGQASRVLKMERHSLEFLLNHFCGVIANKEYQNADWRLRPLPREMIKYAREDTHYLMYIYDLMRTILLNTLPEADSADPPLVEVYKRSYEICTQLYEKELLTDDSYLYIYGLHSAELNAQQLAIVSGLCEWRDVVARSEDESTGYILPNRTLIEIAKQMPLTTNNLRRLLKSKHPYIERNLGSVVSIIRHAIQNAAAFEETVEYLKQRRLEMVNEQDTLAAEEESEMLPSEVPQILENAKKVEKMDFKQKKVESQDIGTSDARLATSGEVTVQTLKKPSRAFGALLGGSGKRKFDTDKREQEAAKLGQIKSTVILPFHSFVPKNEQVQPDAKNSPKASDVSANTAVDQGPANVSILEDIITLDDDSDIEDSGKAEPEAVSNDQLKVQTDNGSESDDEDEPMTLAHLSSSFQCLSSNDHSKNSKVTESKPPIQVKPFDYDAARKVIQFGRTPKIKAQESNDDIAKSKKKGNAAPSVKGGALGETADIPQGKRRQAFPASGNRSATFRNV